MEFSVMTGRVLASNALPEVPENPRPVSRGLNLQLGCLGIDSLYIVLEYPHLDVYTKWASEIADLRDKRLYSGIPVEDFVVRVGGNGYLLSVWDGDARLFLTDRVDDELTHTSMVGQGMGVMLQLGPKWLHKHGDVVSPEMLIRNAFAQFTVFGIHHPEQYPARLNRLDINLDVLGLRVADFSIDQWRNGWVGHARQKHFHDSSLTGQLEGLSIGSSEGAIRFKVYDKVAEARTRNTLQFWRSVWGLPEGEETDVARFEWSVRAYKGRFAGLRYLDGITFEGFLGLLNYVSFTWGRLCVPQADDGNKSRWELDPLWQDIRYMIDDWSINYPKFAKREYEYKPDLNQKYLTSMGGWLGGFLARVGIEHGLDTPAGLNTALNLLEERGVSLTEKAVEKWEVFSKLVGGGNVDEQ
jgi:hypothetical protein